MMRAHWHGRLYGQSPFGVYTNIFDAADRRTVGGWYLCFHFRSYRLQLIGGSK